MPRNVEFSSLIQEPEFQRQLRNAAYLSFSHNRESGFAVHSDSSFDSFTINAATLGKERSIFSDMTQIGSHEPGVGYYIPRGNYRLVSIHYHPPFSNFIPSQNDIAEHLSADEANEKLRDYEGGHSFDDDLYETVAYYPQSVSLIGVVKKDPTIVDYLIFQSRPGRFRTILNFEDAVGEYYERIHGKPAWMSPGAEYSVFLRVRSVAGLIKFLNESNLFFAETFKIKNGKISQADLEKLARFRLVYLRNVEKEDSQELEDEDYSYLDDDLN